VTKKDTVIVSFGKPVVWIGMKSLDARKLAVNLMDRTNDVACEVCGDLYRNHPHDMKQLGIDDQLLLRVRCDGRRLKL